MTANAVTCTCVYSRCCRNLVTTNPRVSRFAERLADPHAQVRKAMRDGPPNADENVRSPPKKRQRGKGKAKATKTKEEGPQASSRPGGKDCEQGGSVEADAGVGLAPLPEVEGGNAAPAPLLPGMHGWDSLAPWRT